MSADPNPKETAAELAEQTAQTAAVLAQEARDTAGDVKAATVQAAAELAEKAAETARQLAEATAEKAAVIEAERAALAVVVAEKLDASMQVLFRQLRTENRVLYFIAIALVIVAVVMG